MAVSFTLPPGLAVLSRRAWRDVLLRHVRSAEQEPHWRRRDRRHAVRFGAWRLLFHNERRIAVSVRVELLNASACGVMLRSRQEVPERVPVLLVCREEEGERVLLGEVSHCTSTVGGHKIGIELRFAEGAASD